MPQELRDLNSCIFHTLKGVFSYVRVIPGDGTNLFLSSDSPQVLSIDNTQVLERSNQRNIEADVIVPWYIERKLHPGWQDWFASFIQGGSQRINSDLNPVGLFYTISHWNALFAPSLRWLFQRFESRSLFGFWLWDFGFGILAFAFPILLLLHLVLPSKNGRFLRAGIPLSIITTGFAGMIFDLMLIFTFQSIHGYVFSWIGLLVASFMAGAAGGAVLTTRVLARLEDPLKLFTRVDLAIVCFSIGCPLALAAVHRYLGTPGALPIKMLFLVTSFFSGLLIGCQFPLANEIYRGSDTSLSKTAGLLYASDLLGGWFGGILGAVVLLPVLGLVGTGITVALLKLTSFRVITTRHHRHAS